MRVFTVLIAFVLAMPVAATAQMTYRVKGVVRDNDGKVLEGVRVRGEALIGFRGEQFVGQKEFATTTNARGEWTMLGLTSGIWAFEATGADLIPQVVLLPINFTNRKPQSAQGGAFPWDLPLWVRRFKHEALVTASKAAAAKQTNDAVAAIGSVMAEKDPEVRCAAGEVALLVRQNGLARAVFEQILKEQPRHPCATLGLSSAALMQNDYDLAAKMLWAAVELAPQPQRAALGAAIKDLQQITASRQ
jgi:hypothetical protein